MTTKGNKLLYMLNWSTLRMSTVIRVNLFLTIRQASLHSFAYLLIN